MDETQMEGVTGREVVRDDVASVGTGCTYIVHPGAEGSYHVNVRIDDAFADMTSVAQSFGQGEAIPEFAVPAYWVPDVTTFWFEAGDGVAAVQLLGFPGDAAAALELAEALARETHPTPRRDIGNT